jgi:hypothetical protein
MSEFIPNSNGHVFRNNINTELTDVNNELSNIENTLSSLQNSITDIIGDTTITKQGNTFNNANELVKLDENGIISTNNLPDFQLAGTVNTPDNAISTNTLLSINDNELVLVDSNVSITITLPNLQDNEGKSFIIKNIGTANIFVNTYNNINFPIDNTYSEIIILPTCSKRLIYNNSIWLQVAEIVSNIGLPLYKEPTLPGLLTPIMTANSDQGFTISTYNFTRDITSNELFSLLDRNEFTIVRLNSNGSDSYIQIDFPDFYYISEIDIISDYGDDSDLYQPDIYAYIGGVYTKIWTLEGLTLVSGTHWINYSDGSYVTRGEKYVYEAMNVPINNVYTSSVRLQGSSCKLSDIRIFINGDPGIPYPDNPKNYQQILDITNTPFKIKYYLNGSWIG